MLGVILGVIFFFLHISRFYYPLIFIIPFLIFKFIKQSEKSSSSIENETNPQKRAILSITVVFLFLLSFMNILVFLNRYFFEFIYGFYILSILVFMVLVYQIVKKIYNIPSILTEIMLFGLSLRIHNFFSYNGIIGIDPHYHMGFINDILTNSVIPSGELYSFFPLFHLEIVNITILTLQNLKFSYFYISIIQLICIIFFVYLMGRELFKSQVALLASLIVTISPAILENNITIVPSTFAVAFFTILVFLLFSNKVKKFIPLIILFTIVIILTHHLSSFIYLIWLILFIGTIFFFNIFIKKERQFYLYFFITLIFLIFYWSIAFNETISGTQSFFDSIINTLRSVLLDTTSGSEFQLEKVYNTSVPFQNILFIDLFNLIGISLLITGAFLSLEKKTNIAKLGIITTLMALFVLGASTMGISQIIPQRWFYFINCIAAIPIAYTIFRILTINKRSTYFIGFACILLIGSLGMIHPYATIFNPIIQEDNIATRIGYTDSELAASCFVNLKSGNDMITSDLVYASEISTPSCSPSLKKINNVRYLYPQDESTYNSGTTIIRIQNKFYPSIYSSGIPPAIVDSLFLEYFETENFNRIYSNENVRIFLK